MDLNILKNIYLNTATDESAYCSDDSRNDIAIIGINAQVGAAKNTEEFWEAICQGCDMIRDFPSERWKDANMLSLTKANRGLAEEPLQYGYLDRIDLFDAEVFGISPKEAELMNPSQRIFLESAWSALEDAGYGGNQLSESLTGVYVGCNNISDQYNAISEDIDPYTYGIAVSGNVNSIIASRISYFLNLKGSAVIFDTACSSSLVAVHFACQQIKDGEISMAIVGGIRLTTIPPQPSNIHFGIESTSGRTKTFDNSADGTGGGEGVVTMVLKPLNQAVINNDNIYAVIKGSSINQDGASVGITAPNAAAQETVIRAAWKDAEIDPETISYIEAHGTATNLGDPVEITGIERAFRHYTDKMQFCAIGSVKSNVGHLDSAAGMTGLLKAVLMMKYKKIPPTIHYKAPNKKIDFILSPVYVNDKLRDWERTETPRRCGISSFGISGTNCHLILEEMPKLLSQDKADNKEIVFLTVSAKNKETVIRSVKQYQSYLRHNPECDFNDFCYTANIGRKHYNCRVAFVLESRADFLNIIVDMDILNNNECKYGEFKVVDALDASNDGYISSALQKKLTGEASAIIKDAADSYDKHEYKELLLKVLQLYVRGADVPWEQLYKRDSLHKISIPTYPYNHKRYWVENAKQTYNPMHTDKAPAIHPLIDTCVLDTHNMQVYSKIMSNETCWELKEHLINGNNVLPGTAFIEMAQCICSRIYKTNQFELEDLLFLAPLTCSENEVRTIHTIVKTEDNHLEIGCYSKNNEESEWLCHVELKAKKECKQKNYNCNIEEIISEREEVVSSEKLNDLTIVKIEGDHWNNVSKIFINDDGIVLQFNVNQNIAQEKNKYYLYTPVLDSAINAGTYMEKSQYLPFSFKKARFYEELPNQFYSYLKKTSKDSENDEFAIFDILFCTAEGHIIGELENYVIKKVHNPEIFMVNKKMQKNMFYTTDWIEYQDKHSESIKHNIEAETALVLYTSEQKSQSLLRQLKERFKLNLVTVEIAEEYEKLTDSSYKISNQLTDYLKVLKDVNKEKITHIIQLASFRNVSTKGQQELENETSLLLKSTFFMVKALLKADIRQAVELLLLTLNATNVTGDEKVINPINRALIGMGACIEEEYSNIKVRSIDTDENTDINTILEELITSENKYSVAYRNNKKYIEQMNNVRYSEKTNQQELELKDSGTYVIAGGVGGMGIAISKYLLAVNTSINVILLNRTYSQKDFEVLIKGRNSLLNNKIDSIHKLWSEGKNVELVKADISNYSSMQDALEKLRAKYGSIDGVINAAGVEGNGFIMKKDWATFEDVLKPKIYGTWILHDLTLHDDLTFFVMCSSFTSVFGAPGQSDYTAANAYLDSFTYYRRNYKYPSLTINWTGWNESGMAVTNKISENGSYVKFVNDAEGAVAFSYALRTNLPRVLVGEINNQVLVLEKTKYERKINLPEDIEKNDSDVKKINKEGYNISNITISGKSLDELTDVEKQVISVWAQTLNISEIDIYDKFFESGGNSLLASYLQKELNKVYPGIVAITDVFIYSTVVEIAEYIASSIYGKKEKKKEERVVEDELDIEKLVAQFVNGDIDIEAML